MTGIDQWIPGLAAQINVDYLIHNIYPSPKLEIAARIVADQAVIPDPLDHRSLAKMQRTIPGSLRHRATPAPADAHCRAG